MVWIRDAPSKDESYEDNTCELSVPVAPAVTRRRPPRTRPCPTMHRSSRSTALIPVSGISMRREPRPPELQAQERASLTSGKSQPLHLTLALTDSPITTVDSIHFLGTTITQDLKWEPSISSLVKKAQQRMYFLRQLKKAKLPAQMMVQFYTAITESILTSSITVWYADWLQPSLSPGPVQTF
ncbi:hypothetical protein WMY93_030585 [Mugilogobius chulae]|uniref:Alkylated DNA repair protein AlkB homologue 8 N-terminal domain-containing protein n=1 Tax=Mugilogobius chulae TaxID=88201 RepID=A0AAW0MHF9_9GOBI